MGEPFSLSLTQLHAAVRGACSGRLAWQEKVTTGIGAALVFAAANPKAASALTVDGRGHEEELIDYFEAQLGEVIPVPRRSRTSSDRAVIGSMIAVARGYILEGMAGQLPDLLPDLAYFALMPYLGIEAARRLAASLDAQR